MFAVQYQECLLYTKYIPGVMCEVCKQDIPGVSFISKIPRVFSFENVFQI